MKKTFFLFSFLLLTLMSSGQESVGIPPSPTVASLVTVEKDSVNSSGKIVHNTSLWNMALGKYSFPISLSYSSSGVKVEETPSYVGTGWNFSAGGVITRSVMDHPDDLISADHGLGMLHTNIMNEIETFNNVVETTGYNAAFSSHFFRFNINDNNLETRNDTQPDLFYFNFFNYSGKFLFNKDKEIVSLSNDNFKYTYTLDPLTQSLKTFTIIDTNGIEYLFAEREFSLTHNNSNSQWEFLSARAQRQKQLNFYSSWHLTKVTTPDNLEILFAYENETLSYRIKDSEMGKICFTQQCEDTNISDTSNYDILNSTTSGTTDFVINAKKIKSITSDFFNVQFNNSPREDLNGGLKLNEMIVKNSNNTIIEKYNFQYSYFLSPNMPNSNNHEYKRLKLDNILKNNKTFQEFEYYTDYALPHRKSTEQDFWGYFNDNNATSLVPKVYTTFNGQSPDYHIFPPLNETVTYEYGSVDRNVNASTIHMGMLKKIQYKTDGYKEFFYEPNDFTLENYTNGSSTLKGNGVRVDRIEYFDGHNIESLNYTYNSPNTGISSGRLSHLPKFATHIPWNHVYSNKNGGIGYSSPKRFSWFGYFNTGTYWYTDYTQDPPVQVSQLASCLEIGAYGSLLNYLPNNNPNNYFAMTTRRFSSSQIPLESNVDQPLVYEYISIKEGNNGKKLYNFDILGALDVSIPTALDLDKFMQKQSFATTYWNPLIYDGNNLYQNNPPCPQALVVDPILTRDDFFQYFPLVNLSGTSHPFAPKPNWNKYFGQLKNYTYINEDGFKVYKEEYEYDLKGNLVNNNADKKIISLKYRLFNRPVGWGITTSNLPSTGPTAWLWSFYDIYYNIGLVPAKTIRTNYSDNEAYSVEKVYDNEYTHGNLLANTSTQDSKGNVFKTEYKYPIDFHAEETSIWQDQFGNWHDDIVPNMYKLMSQRNMIYNPIEIIEKVNNNIVSAQINEYTASNTGILFEKTYNLETPDYNYNYIQASAQPNSSSRILNKDANMVERFSNDRFDVNGNVLQMTEAEKEPVTMLWGYNKSLPIARIEGATYADVNTWFFNDHGETLDYLNTVSNDASASSESNFRVWLNKLRATINNNSNGNIQIVTLTYNPLIGVASITDIKGEITHYKYDNFNRLKSIKDKDGNILSENKYNYKSHN